jgi:hypothetical protein
MTFTSAADLAAMICRAVDYEGEWPEVSGICGNKITVRELLGIGARVRGASYPVLSFPFFSSLLFSYMKQLEDGW